MVSDLIGNAPTRLLEQELERRRQKIDDGGGPEQGKLMGMMGSQGGHPCRESGAQRLRSTAAELRRRADALEALADAVPAKLAELSPAADESLWTLAQNIRM